MARFADGLAVGPDLVHAAESAVSQAVRALGQRPDLLCVFVSGDDPDDVQVAGLRAIEASEARAAIGCSASGVIGGGRGIELTSAVGVWAAALPGVRLTPFALESSRGDESVVVTGMPERRDDSAACVLFADPYTFPVDAFVERSNDVLSGLPLVGGLASGSGGEGATRLFIDGRAADHGAVGVVLGGPVRIRPFVSQGCRPIGPTMVVTGAERNVLLELAGEPALTKLEKVVASLPAEDQTLVTDGLRVGVAMNEYAELHERGDFVVRGVIALDRELDAIAIGDVVDVGRTVRFHVRDPAAAEEELRDQLTALRNDADFGPIAGGLLFSCTERGGDLFPSADHDVLEVKRTLGTDGVGGFFAAGEIGPVSGRNHVHALTASFLAFEADGDGKSGAEGEKEFRAAGKSG